MVKAFPNTSFLPVPKSAPAGHTTAAAHLLWQVFPRYPCLEYKNNSGQSCPVRYTWTASFGRGLMFWQKRFNLTPQFVAYQFPGHLLHPHWYFTAYSSICQVLLGALRALDAGMVVYYTTLSRLIADLKKAQTLGHLERRWRIYLRPALLVIDEVGYMQLSRQEAELLFRLISERYEHGSVILTSNKYFSDWGELLSDNVLATALLDRLLHHAHVVNIRGQTYRLRDRLKAGIQTVPPATLPADG